MGWPTHPHGGLWGKCMATSRAATAHEHDIDPLARGSSPCRWCGSHNSYACQELSKMTKKQSVMEEVQGGCWLSLAGSAVSPQKPVCQFASTCVKKYNPNRSHLSRAVRWCSGHLLVYRGHNTMYQQGMLRHHASLQLSSWAAFCWHASHEWGQVQKAPWGPCLERR